MKVFAIIGIITVGIIALFLLSICWLLITYEWRCYKIKKRLEQKENKIEIKEIEESPKIKNGKIEHREIKDLTKAEDILSKHLKKNNIDYAFKSFIDSDENEYDIVLVLPEERKTVIYIEDKNICVAELNKLGYTVLIYRKEDIVSKKVLKEIIDYLK